MSVNARTARLGVNAVERIVVRDLHWIFREQAIEDYGIDAHIETCVDGEPTGRLIAAQIKTGESWFRHTTDTGYVYTGSDRHLRYWMSHSLPVILILCDPIADCAWWVPIEIDRITQTDDRWSVVVPFESRLDANATLALWPLALPDYRKRRELSLAAGSLLPAFRVKCGGTGSLLDAFQAAASSLDLVYPYIDSALLWVIKTLSHRITVRLIISSRITPEVEGELEHVTDESPHFVVRVYGSGGRNVYQAKFALLDKAVAIYGSANLTAASWRNSYERVLASSDAVLVEQIQTDFDRLWTDAVPWGQPYRAAHVQKNEGSTNNVANRIGSSTIAAPLEAASAEPPARRLARGSKNFAFEVVHYADNRQFDADTTCTWDQICTAVAPLLLNEASESSLIACLEQVLLRAAQRENVRHFGHPVKAVGLPDSPFRTIMMQLCARGLIQVSWKQHPAHDTNKYWMLTPLGEQYAVEHSAIYDETDIRNSDGSFR